MGALATVLLVLGILMLIEGSTVVFFPKWSLSISKRFVNKMYKHLRALGITEIIVAIILIILGLTL